MIRSILPILVIGFVLVIGVSYSLASLGTLDASVNVTNTSYEESYDAAAAPAQMSLNAMGFLPILLVVAALGGVLLWVVKKA